MRIRIEHINNGCNLLFKSIDDMDEKNDRILNSLAAGNADFIILEKY